MSAEVLSKFGIVVDPMNIGESAIAIAHRYNAEVAKLKDSVEVKTDTSVKIKRDAKLKEWANVDPTEDDVENVDTIRKALLHSVYDKNDGDVRRLVVLTQLVQDLGAELLKLRNLEAEDAAGVMRNVKPEGPSKEDVRILRDLAETFAATAGAMGKAVTLPEMAAKPKGRPSKDNSAASHRPTEENITGMIRWYIGGNPNGVSANKAAKRLSTSSNPVTFVSLKAAVEEAGYDMFSPFTAELFGVKVEVRTEDV